MSPAAVTRVDVLAGLDLLPRVQQTSLVYEGSFRLPGPEFGFNSFGYGGTSIGFNPARGSLFLVGHDQVQHVAEVSIPQLTKQARAQDLKTGTMLQPLVDVLEGRLNTINPTDPNSKKIGGILPWKDKLYLTAYSFYDGMYSQVLSHFVCGQTLNMPGDLTGPFRVGAAPLKAGYVSGYFGLVPTAWQAVLGGPVLNGQSCLATVGRTSFGPAVFTIDPETIGPLTAPAAPLVYYDGAHPLGQWEKLDARCNGTTEIRGVVFPEGSRSVLFFGRHGTGPYCYGDGAFCKDPTDESKGTHGYPYEYRVWAYDAVELAQVKAGARQPWSVLPYAIWPLTFPYKPGPVHLNGATYDPGSGRIYLSQAFGDGDRPALHALKVVLG